MKRSQTLHNKITYKRDTQNGSNMTHYILGLKRNSKGMAWANYWEIYQLWYYTAATSTFSFRQPIFSPNHTHSSYSTVGYSPSNMEQHFSIQHLSTALKIQILWYLSPAEFSMAISSHLPSHQHPLSATMILQFLKENWVLICSLASAHDILFTWNPLVLTLWPLNSSQNVI